MLLNNNIMDSKYQELGIKMYGGVDKPTKSKQEPLVIDTCKLPNTIYRKVIVQEPIYEFTFYGKNLIGYKSNVIFVKI